MARFALIALLLLTIGTPLRAQTPQPRDVEGLFARALELQQAGDTLGAIEAYKMVLATAPDRADALSNLGAAYVKLGQYDDAIQQYEAALKAAPMSTATRLNLALAYYKSARPNLAIPQLKRVVASDPESRNGYLLLADCYLQTGQQQELLSLLKPREQMFGDDLAYAFMLGTALLQTGATAEGQKYVDRVFGAGESAEAHLLMGVAHLGRQDYPAAKTELQQSIALNPRVPTAHSLYGRSLLALGEQAMAERAFAEELRLNVNDFEANLQLGNMRKSAQKFPEASTYLERAVTIRPNDLTARKLLASLRLQTGQVDEAVRMLESLTKDAADLVEVHVQLATAYNRLRRSEDAQREREIIDRLNAEIQAKQRGSDAPTTPDGGGR
jgi:tetratricopeptide (TPR) repeat protein